MEMEKMSSSLSKSSCFLNFGAGSGLQSSSSEADAAEKFGAAGGLQSSSSSLELVILTSAWDTA